MSSFDGDEQNCTLRPKTCLANELDVPSPGTLRGSHYRQHASEWLLPLVTPRLHPRWPLTAVDLQALMSLCAFESQIGVHHSKDSRWCSLFDHLDDETERRAWQAHAYIYDVTKWYDKGPGSVSL